LQGNILESVYLGGMAQHVVQLQGDIRVRVAELNPPRSRSGGQVSLVAEPADVVVLTR